MNTKEQKNLVILIAGGKGRRLKEGVPELGDVDLPKSLAIQVEGRPLIAHQIDILLEVIPNPVVVLAFNDQISIDTFNGHVAKGEIPTHPYLLNTDEYTDGKTSMDVIHASGPHTPWEDRVDSVLISSGDIFTSQHHILSLWQTFSQTGRLSNVFTLSTFLDYMKLGREVFSPIIESDGEKKRLTGISFEDGRPTFTLSHPFILTPRAFRIYKQMGSSASKARFVSQAMSTDEKFLVVSPDIYFNLNLPEDYRRLVERR